MLKKNKKIDDTVVYERAFKNYWVEHLEHIKKNGKVWNLSNVQSYVIVAYCLIHDVNVENFLRELKCHLEHKIDLLEPHKENPPKKNEELYFQKIISNCLRIIIGDHDEFVKLHNLSINDRYRIVEDYMAKSIIHTIQLGTKSYSYSNNELFSTPNNTNHLYYLVIRDKSLAKFFSLEDELFMFDSLVFINKKGLR